MGKLVVSENVTLDGVVQAGDEGFARGGWYAQIGDKDREAWAHAEFEEALGAGAMLMGRRTYEWLVARGWPSRDGAWADRLRTLPKYVISSSRGGFGAWPNTVPLNGDVEKEVVNLKQNVSGDIVVNGSAKLVRTLMEHDLVDELRLMTYPFILGAGDRLFGETSDTKPMRLVEVRTVGDGLALLTYQRSR